MDKKTKRQIIRSLALASKDKPGKSSLLRIVRTPKPEPQQALQSRQGGPVQLKARPHGFLYRAKPWFLVLLAIGASVSALFALRDNNLRMIELRQAVYDADKNNAGIEDALRNLREHVYGHMNTNLATGPNAVRPPIQLKYTYERLAKLQEEQQIAQKAAAGDKSGAIYTEAQKYCEKTVSNGASGRFRLDCIKDYVKKQSVDTQATITPTSVSIPKNLYQFDFVSPRWSPDRAGWSIVAAVVLFASAVCIWVSRIIRNIRYKPARPTKSASKATKK